MEEKKVRDLMLKLDEYAIVTEDCTIRDALVMLSNAQLGLTHDRHHHRAVLVQDANGKVVGKLSHWAILRSLEPRFLDIGNEESLALAGLSGAFIQSLKETLALFSGDLQRLCRAAARVKAKDAMVPVGEAIDEDAPLTDTIHEMVLKHTQSLLVTRKGRVIGILRLSDVFEEVAGIIREGDGTSG